jgi:hypothetical protein
MRLWRDVQSTAIGIAWLWVAYRLSSWTPCSRELRLVTVRMRLRIEAIRAAEEAAGRPLSAAERAEVVAMVV